MRAIIKSLATLISSAALMAAAQAQDWPAYRHDAQRTGVQPTGSALSDPAKVKTLSVKWESQIPGTPRVHPVFQASPIIVSDTVFIGSTGGYFYALDAASGALKWQWPKLGDPPLLGSCSKFGGYGIQSSATYAKIGTQEQDAVIFGAPDPTTGLGSARLFALSLSGNLIWKSDVVANVTGCTGVGTPPPGFSELHERIGHSSPLVLGDKVYVGIHDTADNPIQQGRVRAVDLSTGHLVPSFSYVSTGGATRGGGVWNSLAADTSGAVYFTTGNTRIPSCSYPYSGAACPAPSFPEPSPDYGLSMLRVDKNSGNIAWPKPFKVVPFDRDGDDDWAAGAAVMSSTCGELVVSVQKDGWSYGVNASTGSMAWQFPSTGFTNTFLNAEHGDNGYRVPGAAWNNVFIVKTGGESLIPDNVTPGYTKLHALDACATTEKNRVLWIADIPHTSGDGTSLGAPTVTGGVVFVGTDNGHLVVLGDPSIVPPAGTRCSDIDFTTAACVAAGYSIVQIPEILADVHMPDGGNIANLNNEAALADGKVFIGTQAGHVYMLAP